MMKRLAKWLLPMLLCVLLLTVVPRPAHSAYLLAEGTCGDNAVWSLDSTGTLTVSGSGAIYDYVFQVGPDHHLPPWNEYTHDITKLVLSPGITRVGNLAFAFLYDLEEVSIPSTVTELGTRCFESCDRLLSVTIPGTVKVIGEQAFTYSDLLQSVTIGYGVETIGDMAFERCVQLQEITIPGSVSRIGDSAFSACLSLSSLTVEQGVSQIGDFAFSGCEALTAVSLPESLTVLGNCVFSNCTALTEVTIPRRVEELGYAPFAGCTGLTRFTVAENNPYWKAEQDALLSHDGTLFVQVLPGRTGDYTVPEGVTRIGRWAFRECRGLTGVTVPGTVSQIEEGAFWNCEEMSRLWLQEGVEVIGENAFIHCDSLANLLIPGSVTQIRRDAFDYCDVLNNILFAGDAPSIDFDAFSEVTATVWYSENAEGWNGETMLSYSGNLIWKPQVIHEILPDSDTAAVLFREESLTLHIEGSPETLQAVYVDGLPLAPEHYRVTGEDVTLTIAPGYLTALEPGLHSVTVWFADGYAEATVELSTDHEHQYGETETVLPDCTKPGHSTFVCALCGNLRQQTLEPLGHDYVEGICSRCGGEDPAYFLPERIGGADRIATSLGIADALKEEMGVEKFPNIVVASALNFPDALAGSYLAAEKEAPILLTYSAVHTRIAQYIRQNLAPDGTVYILGGTTAVSHSFELELTALGISFRRVAGENRFDTDMAILQEAGVTPGQTLLVCTGYGFADSLSVSATGLPVMLAGDALTNDQKAFLDWFDGSIRIIGGYTAVSEALETELKQYSRDVERIAGTDRHVTSALVARAFFPEADSAVLAYSLNFPDGLCGGPLAHCLNAPLILTLSGDATPEDYMEGNKVSTGYVLGTGELIDDASIRRLFRLDTDAEIPRK